ncbi:NAD-dependent epimerase/dehydratase family protein [Fulvivirgaceae bacterium BMA12]|uniref:NAD-dependent epimerase/dehydratase family protein n=1 Tax=Agaribacillus aureus TaxID=3051825 RepID=A0ABT8LFM4_9BACT|nr:NAD-dependent epimerase/dehydratase family protein [Fulvivirgaceae bacterium BMA12]
MENNKTALIAGATGLIGSHLLKILSTDSYYREIIVITRKKLTGMYSDKVKNLIIDFDNLNAVSFSKIDDVYCCLGTTMKAAGSREAFYKVDFTYPVTLAKMAADSGARKYLVVTAMGADKNSRFYYNRVKGAVEEALKEIGFSALFILQPSLLLGARTESRPGERFAQLLARSLSFLFFGPFKKYKAIEGIKVAQALALLGKTGSPGVKVVTSNEIADIST